MSDFTWLGMATQGMATQVAFQLEAARQYAKWAAWAAGDKNLYPTPSWSTPLPKPPGITWQRTGGKTWRVEVRR